MDVTLTHELTIMQLVITDLDAHDKSLYLRCPSCERSMMVDAVLARKGDYLCDGSGVMRYRKTVVSGNLNADTERAMSHLALKALIVQMRDALKDIEEAVDIMMRRGG